MVGEILIGITIVYLLANLYYFFTNKSYKASKIEPALFYKLFFVMTSLTLGFSILYYLLSFQYDNVMLGGTQHTGSIEKTFLNYLYFSGVTILTVGYGDMVPVGSTRFFALLQATLGFLLPSAYFIKAMGGSSPDSHGEENHNTRPR